MIEEVNKRPDLVSDDEDYSDDSEYESDSDDELDESFVQWVAGHVSKRVQLKSIKSRLAEGGQKGYGFAKFVTKKFGNVMFYSVVTLAAGAVPLLMSATGFQRDVQISHMSAALANQNKAPQMGPNVGETGGLPLGILGGGVPGTL